MGFPRTCPRVFCYRVDPMERRCTRSQQSAPAGLDRHKAGAIELRSKGSNIAASCRSYGNLVIVTKRHCACFPSRVIYQRGTKRIGYVLELLRTFPRLKTPAADPSVIVIAIVTLLARFTLTEP